MLPPKELSPAAKVAVEQEAQRIAELGDAWQPTSENLTKVVEAVLHAEEDQPKKKAEDTGKAKMTSASSDRLLHKIPPNFEKLYRQCQAGELLVKDVTYQLGISVSTYYKWARILRDQGEGVPGKRMGRKPQVSKKSRGRPKGFAKPDEAHLLALLRDAAPGPKSATVISQTEIAERMGCSYAKVKALIKSMEEKGLIETRKRNAEGGAQLANAYRITRTGKRLLSRAFEDEQGEKE